MLCKITNLIMAIYQTLSNMKKETCQFLFPAELAFEVFTGDCIYQNTVGCKQVKQDKIDAVREDLLAHEDSWKKVVEVVWRIGRLVSGMPGDRPLVPPGYSPFLLPCLLTCRFIICCCATASSTWWETQTLLLLVSYSPSAASTEKRLFFLS